MDWLPRKSSNSRLKGGQYSQDQSLPEMLDRLTEWEFAPSAAGLTAMESNPHSGSNPAQVVKLHEASVILPVYNEQACIDATFKAVLDYARQHPTYQFLFVNDGSSDRTQQILEQHIAAAAMDQICLVSYPERGGKGYAVRQGVKVADGEYVCFMDGDLAYSLDHLDILFSKLEIYDVVIGSRSLVPGGNLVLQPARKLAGEVFNTLSKRILNLPFLDMQAGLKGFRKPVARELFARQDLTGFSFDVELIYLAKKFGFLIGEIPAKVSASHLKKNSKVNLLVDSLKMLKDLFRIRLNDVLGRYE